MRNQDFDLRNKVALITGSAGLLGYEHSFALLECNCDIIITDINLNGLKNLESKLGKIFPERKIYSYQMDVTQIDSIRTVENILKDKEIDINILINNAAIDPKVKKEKSLENSRLENFSLDDWNLQISVGLTGAFLCSQVFGSHMAEKGKGGVIVNIASDLSLISPDQRLYENKLLMKKEQPVKPVTYSVIKSGLIGLTKYLATYWRENNIRCNALSPGGIYNGQPKEFVDKISKLIPLGRMAKREEYRSAMKFLCSEGSSYMNGHNLVIDGGRSIW